MKQKQENLQLFETVEIPKSRKLEICLNTLNHMFIGIIGSYIIWYGFIYGFATVRSYHVIFCSIGVLLLVEGILSLYSGNTWTLLARRYSKIRAHWLLQGTGFILIITGIVIEYIDKDKIGREHWEAFHSIVGLTSAVFMLFAVAFGVSAYYSQKLKDFFKPLHIKIFHNVIATITISTGMSSMIIAYFTKNTIIEHDPGNNVRFWMAGFTSITLLITLLGPLKTLTFQIKTALKS